MAKPAYTYIPTQVLDEQSRADAAAAWAQKERAATASRWADLHTQNAQDVLGPLMGQSYPGDQGSAPLPEPAAASIPPVVSGPPGLATQGAPDDPVGNAMALLGGDTSGDRPPSEFEQQPTGRSVGGSFDVGRSVGGAYGPAQDALPPPLDVGADRYAGPAVTQPITPQDAGQPAAPTMRPEYRRISGRDGGPTPMDIPAALDVPNRVAFQGANALQTGQDPAQSVIGMAAAGAPQARGQEILQSAGVSDPETARVLGKILDSAADWTNLIPGVTLGKRGLMGEVVAPAIGATIGSEAGGALGERIGGASGRQVGELAGGLLGAGAGASRYKEVAENPATQRLGITEGGGTRRGVEDAAGAVPGAEVARLRLDKFPEDVRGTIERAAGRGDFWTQQRRNVIPDAQAERMADELGRTVDELIAGGRAGRAYNTEETRALRNALTGQALHVDDLKQTVEALGDAASDAVRRELGQAEANLLALSRVAEGGRAEAGRTFRAYLADTRGRLASANAPAYTSVSRVPTPGVPVAPGSTTPAVTEQLNLITEPVATSAKATNLIGETKNVGAGARSVYDRASLVRLAGMLSGPPTHLINAAGNVVQGGVTLAMKEGQVGADIVRVGVGRALGKDVARQRFQAEVGPQITGYLKGFKAGVPTAIESLRGNLPQDFARAYDARGLQSGSRVVDAAVEAPLRALAASDAVFRSAAFGGHAAALATRQATQEGLSGAARSRRAQEILGNISDHPGLLDSANNLAARDVFQESRATTDAIAAFKREHASARVGLDVFVPFVKTPYNVAAQGAGMTPAGYASAIQAAKRGETGEAIDRAVRATVGTMAMYAGWQLAANNFLTGAYPADASARSTLPEGWKPYSLRVPSGDGAVYVPIQSLGAMAVPIGIAAIMHDANQRGIDKGDPSKAIYGALGGIGQYVGDMSALQGLNSIFKLITEPERSAERTAESFAASFVPESGLARTVQQALGDAARDPDNPIQAFLAGVPGLSQFVPTKQTPLGQDRARGPSGPVALVSGSRIGVEQPNTVTAALRAAGVGIPEPPKTLTRGALTNVPITSAEQREYRRIAGEKISARVEAYIRNPAWAAASKDRRADKLTDALRAARDDAEREVLGTIGAAEAKRRLARAPAA